MTFPEAGIVTITARDIRPGDALGDPALFVVHEVSNVRLPSGDVMVIAYDLMGRALPMKDDQEVPLWTGGGSP